MRMEVGGVRYRVETDGEGPALLLLHGFTGSVKTWQPFRSSWNRHVRTVGVDLLGHGGSDAPSDPGRYAVERVTEDLAEILDRLEIRRAHVLGYSMGGRLALSFALLRPERVESLILESSSPGLSSRKERKIRRERDEALAGRIERDGVEAFVRYWEELPLFATQKRLPQTVRRAIREERLAQRAAGLAGSLRGMGTGVQPSWWDRLEELRAPVALITGEEDRKFCRIAAAMEARLSRVRRYTVPRAGHAVHVERPRLFDTIVLEWIQGNMETSLSTEGG
ncbi:2-succinyl-6-hydroxy-2,4-cyclohexadiene-1-carboxylate synthase [Melghirimyces profundicolus]|uniref:Putative 2-succinyl-6-hydroxy-2,4-cyclohexadiene-1-carboxylate synthase n=1 Tax=Melghirimyces profundicolus TaxID=1242148 RepID=A0A2T6C4Z9_9BACL|nr:2-succinyl-6-hydroxy-2,4-cyclohexadiene-1-carboxylate synthase [Melghirimyces profundicolus]PTX63353.1 2-succinyl-6-hydroxy-2,4-cyclohexadiene-1-carboxylate synthase [Melghirimyces profundicolus]